MPTEDNVRDLVRSSLRSLLFDDHHDLRGQVERSLVGRLAVHMDREMQAAPTTWRHVEVIVEVGRSGLRDATRRWMTGDTKRLTALAGGQPRPSTIDLMLVKLPYDDEPGRPLLAMEAKRAAALPANSRTRPDPADSHRIYQLVVEHGWEVGVVLNIKERWNRQGPQTALLWWCTGTSLTGWNETQGEPVDR